MNISYRSKSLKEAPSATLQLREKVCNRKNAEPDKESIVHTIWKIVGGKNIRLTEAANNLGISRQLLYAYFTGRIPLTHAQLVKYDLRTKFAEHYPATWIRLENEFEERASYLDLGAIPQAQFGLSTDTTITGQWRQTAVILAGRLLDYHGDDIEDILPDIKPKFLQTVEAWQSVLDGTSTLSAMKAAINELCRLYRLREFGNGKTYTAHDRQHQIFFEAAQELLSCRMDSSLSYRSDIPFSQSVQAARQQLALLI